MEAEAAEQVNMPLFWTRCHGNRKAVTHFDKQQCS